MCPIIFAQDEGEVYVQVNSSCNQYDQSHSNNNYEKYDDDILWPDGTTSPMLSRELLRKLLAEKAIRIQNRIHKKTKEFLREAVTSTKNNTNRFCHNNSLTHFNGHREIVACEHGVQIAMKITQGFVEKTIKKNIENDFNIKVNSNFITKEYYQKLFVSKNIAANTACEQKQYKDEVNACKIGLKQFGDYFYAAFEHDYYNNSKRSALKVAKSNCQKLKNEINRNACLTGVMLVCNEATMSLVAGGRYIDDQIKIVESKVILSDLDKRLLSHLRELKRNTNNDCANLNANQKWDTNIKHCIQIEDKYNLMGSKHAHCLHGRTNFKLLAQKYQDQ